MEPVVVLLHPDLGEHLLDEILVGLGTTLPRLLFLPAIVPDEGDVDDVLPKELDLRIRAGLNGALYRGLVRRLRSIRVDLDVFGNLSICRPTRELALYTLMVNEKEYREAQTDLFLKYFRRAYNTEVEQMMAFSDSARIHPENSDAYAQTLIGYASHIFTTAIRQYYLRRQRIAHDLPLEKAQIY